MGALSFDLLKTTALLEGRYVHEFYSCYYYYAAAVKLSAMQFSL